jgi:DNA polymerase elongation subunit (family B)
MERKSNYVAAWMDYRQQKVVVTERDIDTGERFVTHHNPPLYFYVPDEDGEYVSLYREKVKRLEFGTQDEYEQAIRQYSRKYESDFRPLMRVLMDKYYGRPTPPVNFALFDIEVDYKQSIGFSSPTNPYAPINAVTIYQSWTKKFVTLAVPPPGVDIETFQIPTAKEMKDEFDFDVEPDIILVRSELELLEGFLDAIQNADIISGWFSEFFDVPYICERIRMTMGEQALRSLELPGARPPKKEMIDRFGTQEPIYKFFGRAHLDYLQLFEKFTFEGRSSYSLANIAYEELDVPKLEYEGTLEQLYKRDFRMFLLYNIRDVEIIKLLDEKFKFIQLCNQMAHENTVLFPSILGTVAYVETAIANHAHYVLKKVVNDKHISEHDKVEGAVVLSPRLGLWEWIGSVDINSLYPNVIRSLNISPETIIGQFSNYIEEHDWLELRDRSEANLVLILESGEQLMMTAREWVEKLKEMKWAVSAYGTVFDQSRGRGVIPDILGFWYTERKRLQAEKKKWGKKLKELTPDTPEYVEAEKQESHYDLLQLTKKIAMNSLYGALLNAAFRFGDPRMGASVTATGRKITQHMMETIAMALTGEKTTLFKRYVHKDMGDFNMYQSPEAWDMFLNFNKQRGFEQIALYAADNPSIIYGDTDSCYYRCHGATTKEEAVEIADAAATIVNDSFPGFMRDAFNCQPEFDELIKAGREVVGRRGLFQAKKKYMIKVVDLEGVAVDKMKSQGSEIKKADTPKIIQKFLKETVDMILDGKSYEDVCTFVNLQRKAVLKDPKNVFLLGVAKQVNNLEEKYSEWIQYEKALKQKMTLAKPRIPGHVRASINYNELLNIYDKGQKMVRSGDKVMIYYVKPNEYGYKSVAIPADFMKFPEWFNENFQVDIKLTEEKMFDNKLGGVFRALGKAVPTLQSVHLSRIIKY